jgi:hypothetical protein
MIYLWRVKQFPSQMLVETLTEQKFYSPSKIGLLIVTISYFLFTFHAMFTLSWIGEWERLPGSFSFTIFVEDISAAIGLVFRLIASIAATAAITFYFAKRGLSKPTAYRIIRWILVFEAIYWLGLLVTGVMSIQGLLFGGFGNQTTISILNALVMSVIPSLVESIGIPIALFILALKLNPNKPIKGGIKWGLITGTIYIFVFWLLNTSMWLVTIRQKGTEYLTAYPENLFSFAITIVGLLALTMFSAYFTKKSAGTENLEDLKLGTVGVIITALGIYFLWNYLTWIFFGGNYLWSDWYAWFLGHNLDLWLLSTPLVGMPLLFEQKAS